MRAKGMRWFGIPAGLGIACLAALQLERTVRRERRLSGAGELPNDNERWSWQLTAFRLLPARLLSRGWGRVMEKEIPPWLRWPMLGLYVRMFDCQMTEAVEEDVGKYKSFSSLFTRSLKAGARPISREHTLVCPSDGKVLHLGRVDETGQLEQIKGVTYSLHHFLGQTSRQEEEKKGEDKTNKPTVVQNNEDGRTMGRKDSVFYHVTIYLAPGDYHGFHSPTNWSAHTRRHFPGELLTVAPWAVKTMPGLFTLNERVLLLGEWTHGFFSFAAVGAYNVGSISLTIDEELKTNQKGRYIMGQYSDQPLPRRGRSTSDINHGMRLGRGQKLGTFQMGSSIVLIFEAPKEFQFCVEPGNKVKYGQPLGHLIHH